jgi:hypothetical protein
MQKSDEKLTSKYKSWGKLVTMGTILLSRLEPKTRSEAKHDGQSIPTGPHSSMGCAMGW